MNRAWAGFFGDYTIRLHRAQIAEKRQVDTMLCEKFNVQNKFFLAHRKNMRAEGKRSIRWKEIASHSIPYVQFTLNHYTQRCNLHCWGGICKQKERENRPLSLKVLVNSGKRRDSKDRPTASSSQGIKVSRPVKAIGNLWFVIALLRTVAHNEKTAVLV